MALILRADARKCVGCRACELACVFQHEKRFRPLKSRIRVFSGYPEPGLDVPVFCQHCGDMYCARACPAECISRQPDTGAVVIDEDCAGCQACVSACPIGAITWDYERNIPEKCDLCGGSPACLEYCLHGALVTSEEAAGEGDLLHDYVCGNRQDFAGFLARLHGGRGGEEREDS